MQCVCNASVAVQESQRHLHHTVQHTVATWQYLCAPRNSCTHFNIMNAPALGTVLAAADEILRMAVNASNATACRPPTATNAPTPTTSARHPGIPGTTRWHPRSSSAPLQPHGPPHHDGCVAARWRSCVPRCDRHFKLTAADDISTTAVSASMQSQVGRPTATTAPTPTPVT